MDDILAEIRENVARLPDEELIRIVSVDREQYRQEAIATATEELRRRQVVVPPPVVPQSIAARSVLPRSAMPASGDLSSALPHMWPGFAVAAAFLIAEMREAFTDPGAVNRVTLVPVLIALGGWVYWIWCMKRIRKTILEASGDPTVQPHSGFRDSLALHNPVWIFAWPGEVAEFVNRRLGRTALDRRWPSVALFAGILLARVDAALGLAVVFSAGAYIRSKLVAALGPMTESGGAITPG